MRKEAHNTHGAGGGFPFVTMLIDSASRELYSSEIDASENQASSFADKCEHRVRKL